MFTGKDPISERDGNTVEDILAQARDRARKGEHSWSYNYDEAKKDVVFLAGNQWPDKERILRETEGRPALVLNQLPKFVDQVLGDQRQNRPGIKVHPVSADAGNKVQSMNGQDYTLAEVYEGLIKNIEYTCNAESSYDMAFQQAVESGFGWLRVLTDYSDNDAFEQDIKIKSIRDRFSVLIDPRAQEADASDMNWCFVTEMMSKKEFDKRYPDATIGDLFEDKNWWLSDDSVRVAEYFTREPITRRLLLLTDGRTVYHDEVKDVLDELAASGITIQRERKVKTYKVVWRKITAWEVLEGPIDWPGSTIPIVPVFGKDITVDGQPRYMSLIRHAKDAQRMHNYWMTTVTEKVALSPKAPFVGPAKAFSGYENFWNEANRKNLAYLPYNDEASAAPQRMMNSPMPTAEVQMAMSGIDEIKNTIGMFDASLGRQGNETSGRAILARQKEGDTGTFAFVDNLSRSIRRCGKIIVELIPKIYDSERVVRIAFRDGTSDNVPINQSIIDMQTGGTVLVHDITTGKFDVVVETGPSYNTQRMEAADTMMQFVQAVPQAGQVAADLIAMNMDWPGADELAKRLKKVLPQGILTEQEAQDAGINPPPPPPPDPKVQQMQLQMQISQQEAQANMQIEQLKLKQEEIKTQALVAKSQTDLQMAQHKATTAVSGQQPPIDPAQLEAFVRQSVAKALAEYQAGA